MINRRQKRERVEERGTRRYIRSIPAELLFSPQDSRASHECETNKGSTLIVLTRLSRRWIADIMGQVWPSHERCWARKWRWALLFKKKTGDKRCEQSEGGTIGIFLQGEGSDPGTHLCDLCTSTLALVYWHCTHPNVDCNCWEDAVGPGGNRQCELGSGPVALQSAGPDASCCASLFVYTYASLCASPARWRAGGWTKNSSRSILRRWENFSQRRKVGVGGQDWSAARVQAGDNWVRLVNPSKS